MLNWISGALRVTIAEASVRLLKFKMIFKLKLNVYTAVWHNREYLSEHN